MGTTSTCGGGAVDAANSVCLTANTITGEGATADGFETLFSFGDATADQTLTCTGAASSYGCVVASPVQAASTTAGNSLALTASPAIAGSANAGAAAGGNVTITSGAAARLTSGNANGGNIILVGGAGIGTGTAGAVVIPVGSSAAPGLQFTGAATAGLAQNNAGRVDLIVNGVEQTDFGSNTETKNLNVTLGWSPSATTPGLTGADTTLARGAAKVIVSNGWVQQSGARTMLASDYTNATTTFSNTALSITVISGRKYTFRAALFLVDSTAADGVKIDFNGGAATSTNFVAHCNLVSDVGAATVQTNATSAALATVINSPTLGSVNVHLYDCAGSFEPSSSSTFILRAAQNAHSTGTLTIKRGSWLNFEDMP